MVLGQRVLLWVVDAPLMGQAGGGGRGRRRWSSPPTNLDPEWAAKKTMQLVGPLIYRSEESIHIGTLIQKQYLYHVR